MISLCVVQVLVALMCTDTVMHTLEKECRKTSVLNSLKMVSLTSKQAITYKMSPSVCK